MKSAILWGAVGVVAVVTTHANADEYESSFFKDSKSSVLLRNFYMNRDYRNPGASQSKRDEWAQGVIANFSSGFTNGTVGFGIDTTAMLGMKLDSSSDNINTGLLPASGNGVAGTDHAPTDYTKAVGAVKLKYSNTVLKYGEMTVKNPVFMTSDSRLLPETAEGFYLVSKEVPGLTLEAGHFTSIRLRAQTNRASGPLTQADFAGGSYSLTPALTASVYASSIKDYWDKRYLGLTWIKPLDLKSAFTLDFNGYDQKSKGQALGGDLDLRAFSLKAGYRFGGHSAALAYQVIDGRGAYKYGADGSDTNYLVNYIQYMDATHAGEHSWQARYDYDFAAVGVPGLNFMTRYARGDNFKTSAGDGAKEWERNISLAYTIQAGPVKNLNFKIRQATYRSDINSQIDEVRVITEYPLSF